LYIFNILCVTKKPPKMFTAAKTIARNPKMFETSKMFSETPDKDAIMAPTIITDDIALVTDIRGVWREGVTLHTT